MQHLSRGVLRGVSTWHSAAALSGASAVALGAYGAHAFKPDNPAFVDVRACATHQHAMASHGSQLASRNSPVACLAPHLLDWPQVFRRGNDYHLLHSLLLAAAPLARRPHVVGVLAGSGILLFSGSCYAAALAGDRSLARAAPFGGFALILAWLSLALP